MQRFISRQEMRDIENHFIRELDVSPLILMENAGKNAAEKLSEICSPLQMKPKILIICGKGNNGGDGLVMARHLILRKYSVEIFLTHDYRDLSKESQVQYRLLQSLGVSMGTSNLSTWICSSDLIVDALYGVGLARPLGEKDLEVIRMMNQSQLPIFSIDLPSGLDADTGKPHPEAVQAKWTVTFSFPKLGFQHPESKTYTGDWSVADIGVPLY